MRYDQAKRIFDLFGGVRRFRDALELAAELDPTIETRSREQLYRWMQPRDRGGTDGLIPTRALPLVVAAARVAGVKLTLEELLP